MITLVGVSIFALCGLGGWVGIVKAGREKRRAKALQDAHRYSPQNVHGNAGYASKQDARRKGWI